MKKHLLRSFALGTALLAAGTSLFAQGYQCGTDEMNAKLFAKHPELAAEHSNLNALLKAQMQNRSTDRSVEPVYIIPIVFHIIHTNGAENISDAQVIDEVNILNRDFRKVNPDTAAIVAPFQALAADTKIEFRLAQLDPNGNCTNGIDRIYSHKTEKANDDSKLNPWPRDKYLNVWVIKTMESVGTAGYAYYPSATSTFMYPYDGIIIIHSYVGSIGTASVGTSRALTHEVGHWLNLPHTWGSTNEPEVGCGDDGPFDTPITKGHLSCTNRWDYTCDSKALLETYDFGNVTTSSGTTDPTPAPTVVDNGVGFSSFTANGLTANSASAASFDFAGWDSGALNGETVYSALTGTVNTGKYYQFSVTPVLAQALGLTGITFNIRRDANGPRTYVVRSNADGYTANLAATITPSSPNLSVQSGNIFFVNFDTTSSITGSKITLSGASFTNINNTSRTFRIYAYNAEDSTGTFSIDDVTLTGTHGIVENVENYMEYSYCSKMYTYDQKDWMRNALNNTLSARNNLWLPSNLAATGTDGSGVVCTPDPDFYANRTMICAGSSVTFTKNVNNITPGAANTGNWNLPGSSNPTASAAAASVTVTYNTPGTYDAGLTITNTGGTGTTTKTNYISVQPGYTDIFGPYTETFENPSLFWSRWRINDLDNNARTWWLSTDVGYLSSHSVMMKPYYNYPWDVDQLISPSYNLEFMTSGTMTFRCAAATNATTSAEIDDKLVVYRSVDCGASWTVMKTYTGASWLNNSYHPEEFVPSSPSQWALQTITLSSTSFVPNVRFKFEYTTGHESNSIYIDDINISGTVGVEETLTESSVSLYPNPATENTTLSYSLNKDGIVKVEVIDILGKKLMETGSQQTAGDHSIVLSKDQLHLVKGIYMVKVSIDKQSITRKLVIAE